MIDALREKMGINTVKNGNPELAVAKLFENELGLMPIACFLVEGSTYHPISDNNMVYKNGIVIDGTTELWYGKGLCGEGVDSLEETLKGLPPQTVGAWVKKIDGDDEPFYLEIPELTPEEYAANGEDITFQANFPRICP
jgi:hypothetical protein